MLLAGNRDAAWHTVTVAAPTMQARAKLCRQQNFVQQVVHMDSHSKLLGKQSLQVYTYHGEGASTTTRSNDVSVCVCSAYSAFCLEMVLWLSCSKAKSASGTQTIAEHKIVLIISLSAFHADHITQRILACIPCPISIPKIHLMAKTTWMHA